MLPSADTAAMLFWALLVSGQINIRKVGGWQTLAKTGPNLPHRLIRQRDARGSPFSSLHSKSVYLLKQPATYKGRSLLSAPRTEPSGPHLGTRLPPRVFDGEALLESFASFVIRLQVVPSF